MSIKSSSNGARGLPPWLESLRVFQKQFESRPPHFSCLSLKLFPEGNQEKDRSFEKMMTLCHGQNKGRWFYFNSLPGCKELGGACLRGPEAEVLEFCRLSFAAGRCLPKDLYPGLLITQNMEATAWLDFVMRQLRAHPGNIVIPRDIDANIDSDDIALDPFLACAVAIDLAVNHQALAPEPRRDPGQPSLDRQNDIVSTIRSKRLPLTRDELIDAMRLGTEGKLGHNLAWMVKNKLLINIHRRGYWPASDPLPK